MGVMVYPRWGEVLDAKSMTAPELRRAIEERFGLTVSEKALYVLALAPSLERVNLKVAGAAATILDTSLDDLFAIDTAASAADSEAERSVLSPRDPRRLSELFDRQDYSDLSEAEEVELEGLVARYGHLLHERRMRALAEERAIPVDQVHSEVDAELDAARAWWREFERDPATRQAAIDAANRRRARQTE